MFANTNEPRTNASHEWHANTREPLANAMRTPAGGLCKGPPGRFGCSVLRPRLEREEL